MCHFSPEKRKAGAGRRVCFVSEQPKHIIRSFTSTLEILSPPGRDEKGTGRPLKLGRNFKTN